MEYSGFTPISLCSYRECQHLFTFRYNGTKNSIFIKNIPVYKSTTCDAYYISSMTHYAIDTIIENHSYSNGSRPVRPIHIDFLDIIGDDKDGI